jgi:hypothetical protein
MRGKAQSLPERWKLPTSVVEQLTLITVYGTAVIVEKER